MATLVRGVATSRSLPHRLCTPRTTGCTPVLPAIVYVMLGAFPDRGIPRTLFVLPRSGD